MINFAEGWGFNEMSNLQMTKSEIKELIKDLMKKKSIFQRFFSWGARINTNKRNN